MEQNQPAAQPATQERKTVIRNGNVVLAITKDIVLKTLAKAKTLGVQHHGELMKGIRVTGNGVRIPSTISATGKVVPAKYIFNTSLVSEIAKQGNKYAEAYWAMEDAIAAGDLEKEHDAGQALLNAVSVSFSVIENEPGVAPIFAKDSFVQGMVNVLTTEKGSLITLERVSLMPATSVNTLAKFELTAPARPVAAPVAAPDANAFTS